MHTLKMNLLYKDVVRYIIKINYYKIKNKTDMVHIISVVCI